ncbi:MAG: ABC transporter ATP-binding protein [Gammaproteobacteria bacterium]|nr:ABC transporter ATP-binding protein [Gammaproteobacteria bacterium]
MPLLSVKDLRVHFHTRNGVIRAVDGVTFDLEPGRTVGIVGESGSGKSVTCYSLLGLLPTPPARIEGGSAVFDGIELLGAPEATLRSLRGNRICMIFQDPLSSLNPYLSIGTQLIEPLRIHTKLSRAEAREKAIQALHEVGIPEPGRRFHSFPHELSGGMRQRVMIAMAIITEPEVLIADEPTTALDVTIQAQVLDLIRNLQAQRKIATVFVSHNLGVIAGIADDVIVMRDGKCVEQGVVDDLFHRPAATYTRNLLDSIPASAKPTPPAIDANVQDPLLRIDKVRVSFPGRRAFFAIGRAGETAAVDGVSLDVRKGEIMGLVGESGSGKSTLARAVVRLVDVSDGSVSVASGNVTRAGSCELRRLRLRMQMIFQDPYSSLDPRMTVHDCLVEALRQRARCPANGLLREVSALMTDVGLDPALIRKYPHEFSGGQRQRIAIARALALNPDLLIADEPVSSLDVTVQAQILKLLLDLNSGRGLTILFISHDLSVIRFVSDRTAVMYHGKIVELNDTEILFSHPSHPYTKSLLSAIPIPDPRQKRISASHVKIGAEPGTQQRNERNGTA